MLLGTAVFAQIVIFGGSTGAMEVVPFKTVDLALNVQDIPISRRAEVAMTASLLIGWLLYGVGAIGLLKNRRWLDPRAIWMALSIAAGVAVAFTFSRSGYSQMWFQRSAAGLVVIMSAWGLAAMLPDRLTRRQQLLLGGGALVAGLGAFTISWVVDQEVGGTKATYRTMLLTIAVPVACVLAFLLVRWALARRPERSRPPVALLVSVLLGLALTNAFAFVYNVATDNLRDRGRPPVLFAKGGVDAAEWVEAHSDPYDVLATNVHCAQPHKKECDNRNFWISAETERRIVVEGWGYTRATNDARTSGRAAKLPIPDKKRLRINDALFDRPSEETLRALVGAYDVSWLFVSKEYPADLDGLRNMDGMLERTYTNRHYVVYRVLI
jgi:hypothetical protein